MITNFVSSTLSLVKAIFLKNQPSQKDQPIQEVQLPEEKLIEPVSIAEIAQELPHKDKVMFQPNTLIATNSHDFPNNERTNLGPQPPSQPQQKHVITIECDSDAVRHIQNLCRFFEINELDALAKGLWLLTVARDVEINNKKLGVISVDKNGLIVEVSPINIV